LLLGAKGGHGQATKSSRDLMTNPALRIVSPATEIRPETRLNSRRRDGLSIRLNQPRLEWVGKRVTLPLLLLAAHHLVKHIFEIARPRLRCLRFLAFADSRFK
jgi:hypothetical protein